MLHVYWLRRVLFVIFASSVLQAGQVSAANLCEKAMSDQSRARGLAEPTLNWNSDRSLLEALQRVDIFGQVETFFSKKWDTQVYYTKTGAPNAKGEVPLVNPESKAVFIFFHGSGTMKSGGKNFIMNMNNLAKLGFSAISVDMPFHAEGPTDAKFNNAFYFMEWAKSIVVEARKAGKPVYLAGHSFGPDVILEFATRYPKLLDGAVALSPAGFTKVLSKWYETHTQHMKFGGEVPSNDDGGIWAAQMSSQFLWTTQRLADPTQVNPNLKIRILSGNREEYVPAPVGGDNGTPVGENTYDISIPLRQFFKNAAITIEPGIGHYLFDFNDANGINVVTRELLLVAGENPQQIKKMMEQTTAEAKLFHTAGQLAKKYAQDRIFRAWADMVYGPGRMLKIADRNQDKIAQKILTDYEYKFKMRALEIHQKILATKTTHPEFYAKYKTYIETLSPDRVDTSLFFPYLTMIVQQQP